MLSISEIVAKTEEMFSLFNHHVCNDELICPAITVSPDGGRGAYGWCSIFEIWQASGEAYREINICAEARSARKLSAGRATGYIDRPISEVVATMLHEMAHLYNLIHGIKASGNTRDASVAASLSEVQRKQLMDYSALCREIGESEADVALAWLLANPAVTAPIIGPRTMGQFGSCLRAVEIDLSKDVMKRLDEIFPCPGGEAPEAYVR